MSCKTYEATNELLARIEQDMTMAIEWAEADEQHALQHAARGTARDDARRAKTLRKALMLIRQCER